jgi:hypothetical protein
MPDLGDVRLNGAARRGLQSARSALAWSLRPGRARGRWS